MKPILNKETILEFVNEMSNKTNNMPGSTSEELAVRVGRIEVLSELMGLVLKTI